MSIGVLGEKPGVTLHVRDVKRAAAWYREHLGMTEGPTDGKYYAELHANGKFLFHLIHAEDAAPLAHPTIQLQSDDIERTHAALTAAAVQVTPIHWNTDNAGFTFYGRGRQHHGDGAAFRVSDQGVTGVKVGRRMYRWGSWFS